MVSREEAEAAYHEWVATHLRTDSVVVKQRSGRRKLDGQVKVPQAKGVPAEFVNGSLLEISSGLLNYEKSRVAEGTAARRPSTISRKTFDAKKQSAEEFLRFLNSLHGQGAVGRMLLADLTLEDVEKYNRLLVEGSLSPSQVNKRLQRVKSVVDRVEARSMVANSCLGTGTRVMSHMESPPNLGNDDVPSSVEGGVGGLGVS